MTINKISFNGLHAYELTCSPFQAVILPECGGNLIAFRDVEKNYHFLREPSPEDMNEFNEHPVLFGIPVLFPPNRFEDGTFTFFNRKYQFPINEPSRNNHLHGFFKTHPWEVTDLKSSDAESSIELSLAIDEQSEIYPYFPHHFKVNLRYTLSAKGLEQYIGFQNTGTDSMPLMLGFHTTFNAPFSKTSGKDDVTLQLSISERIELNERSLPSGKRLSLNPNEQKIAGDGISPYFAPLDNHYMAKKEGQNRMVLTDRHEKVKLVYETGSKFPFWMLYNKDADSGFFCPEPQTNMVNAPNAPFPAGETGLIELKAGETWSAQSRIFTESF